MKKIFDKILKKFKTKKGFTLIELLAVIVVLAVVLIIAVPAIGKVIENSRQQAYLDDEKMMEKAARTYVMKNSTILPKEIGEKKTILLSDMIKANVIEEIKDPKDKSNTCDGYVEVEKISEKKYDYNAYLKCGDNYGTEGLEEGVIATAPKVTDSNPGILAGTGEEGSPYLIESIEDLVTFGKEVDGGNTYEGQFIRLEVDLDFESLNSYGSEENEKEELMEALTSGEGFNPVGYYIYDYTVGNEVNIPFSGIFNGNNKIIKNLYINRSLSGGVGLFGSVKDGQIKNIKLVNVNVKNDMYGTLGAGTGSLAGNLDNSTVQNNYAMGSVIGKGTIGGLVGSVSNSTIINNNAAAKVTGSGDTIGGLVGAALDFSIIINSYATGNVNGEWRIGGLIGHLSSDSTVTSSYATGNVTGNDYVGGLAGHLTLSSTVSNSYAIGSVTGSNGVGGLVGAATESGASGSITNSYAIGYVTGDKYVGGLVGDLHRYSIINSYAAGNVNGSSNNIGGLVGGIYDIINSYRYKNQICTGCTNTYGNEAEASDLASTDWHTGTLKWSADNWSFTNGKYPLIKKDATTLLGGQTLINTP